jgi:uncharacterized protein (DUF342 family)
VNLYDKENIMGIKDAIFLFNKQISPKKLLKQILSDPKNQSYYKEIAQNFFFSDEAIIQGNDIENFFSGVDIYYNASIGALCVNRTGFVEFNGAKIDILDPVVTLKQNLYAYLILPPLNTKDPGYLVIDNILKIIKDKKILNHTSIENIQKALDFAIKGYGITILLAKGIEPVNGKEAEIKLFFELSAKAGKLKDDGSIDFKEREKFINVKAGEQIGEYIEGRKAVKGYDVFGNEIEPTIESHTGYKAGKNLKIEGSKVLAAIDGIVELDESNRVSINNVIKIDKDIDLSTGNIKSESSILVNGKINPGFLVETEADLIVEESIFNANIKVGGNCRVRHGISGEMQKNKVFVKKDLVAEYIENANIKCGGNIQFTNSILHSKIICGGSIKGIGKSVIIGGEIFASRGIIANEIGSKLAVPTTLIVGVDIERESKLEELKQQLLALTYKLKQVRLSIGDDYFKDPENFLRKLPDSKLDDFEKKLDQFFNLIDTQKELEESLNNLKKSISFKDATIQIKIRIFDGVIIRFGSEVYQNKKEMSGPITFYFDEQQHKILFR